MTERVTVRRRGVSIVERLRVAVVAIGALVLLDAALGERLLNRLGRFQTRVSETTLPALVHASELQRQLADVHRLSERLAELDSIDAVARLEDALASAQGAAQGELGWLHTLDVAREPLERLDAALARLGDPAWQVFSLRRQLLYTESALAARRETVELLWREVGERIAPRLIEIAGTVDTAFHGGAEGRPDIAAAMPAATLHRHVSAQRHLTDVAFRVGSIVKAAVWLSHSSAQAPGTIGRTVNALRQDLRQATLALTRLDAREPSRAALAAALVELDALALGEDGIAALLEGRARTREAFDAQGDTLAAADAAVSVAATELADALREETAAAVPALSEQLDLTRDLTKMSALLAIAMVGLVALVAERQINRRMTRLADAVIEIADGETEIDVGVGGDDELGEIARALEVFKDNARELRRSNHDLEQFAYAAAHDMRSPLRAIEQLAEWTLEDGGDTLAKDCRENLEKLLVRARRLARLQNDLLEYATAGRDWDGTKAVDIGAVIEELREMLDPERRFVVETDVPSGTFELPATPLRQILMNLIANAMRHHDRANGRIGVGARRRGTRLEISVRDDGPGIEPEYHERVFGLFEKLSSRDSVEGSGLGLSLIKKLVERYGGTIALRSDPRTARGASFTFDLPLASAAEAAEAAR